MTANPSRFELGQPPEHQGHLQARCNYNGYAGQTVVLSHDSSTPVHLQEACFLTGALIATRDGESLVETFEIGDRVISPKGEKRTLT
ncbi:Hint domain-containing protein [Gluconobacter kanchanaburiensis]|uniref:Uncharacterized protein n=1 Tax=Gluconobacter kanchanaburiensis NBRC 103587 TaxID=1307948 RepID=A0A511B602_9PROT|nr:Hint domain-containing protein [Gluconobacter kanchanaburiensis]MBF0860690.1 hypothetical protein [Gluconobacter kanchanaburiensis]GBR69614.1 hypothetical protein AA103587_1422 [Gluconobacter kanchanaburiensis NBRC 103587]GEK95133.1 hypothetical protein GKA01_03300 [Gluconobacter kanchanaburiensis NBRC 103587]